MKFGAGQPVRRLEDDRLITGKGQYSDDIALPGTAHMVLLRSPHAHAKIRMIDTLAAREAKGVIAVFTHKDIAEAGLKPLPCVAIMPNRDGTPMVIPARHALAKERVCHLGEPVAAVVAETAAQARDAAELINVDYDELPAVVDTTSALTAAPIHPDTKSNIALDHELGDKAAVDAAFAKAAHVTILKLVNQRVVVNAMEPRACLGAYDQTAGKYTLYTGSQGVHGMRGAIAKLIFGIEDAKLRVVTKDVGGGFGMKSFIYHEYPLVLFAAKKLGRPVKWTSERAEAFLSDTQGRDHVTEAAIALDKDHKILAVRTQTTAALGGYLSHFAPFVPTMAAPGMQVGVYAIPAFYTATKCVFTNTVPVDAYRGAGRPEAAYVIERLVDKAAAELKVDAAELRRKNFIKPEHMPYKFPAGGMLDSGQFADNMDDAMKRADWQGFKSRAASAKAKGKIAGIGMAYYVEKTAGGFEMAHIEVRADGEVHVIAGTQSNGQGHETAYAQLVAERLEVPIEIVKVTSGDSDAIRAGGGTGGSRSLTMAGGAIGVAVKDVVEKGKAIASNELEAAAADIEYANGKFRIAGTDRSLGLFEVARIAKTQANVENVEGIAADGEFKNPSNTWPNGCHICEVEIDPETGTTDITRYTIVDDFGKIVNPLLVEGQVHGGVVQGLGQAMGEIAVYDDTSGQLVTGSFMDYWMPRADNMPAMTFKTNEVPCKTNPLGVKGCGEAGTVGAAPAFVNAVVNALQPYGVDHVDMPLTPLKIWEITKGKAAA
ncbi:MAG: xanthine dehydrogenase family protein molybdopterin-binding subunit [Alphaproteobacteria bacterium]|nr:xanthine dehydrogenase family protein molybdopterin-binding subunit [Alphaproteobacteria bacterium]